MKRLLWAVLLVSGLAGVSRADDGGFQLFQGTLAGEAGKSGQVPVIIKLDSGSGESWRLVSSGGNYWWIPIKTGVIKSQQAPTEEKSTDAPAEPAKN